MLVHFSTTFAIRNKFTYNRTVWGRILTVTSMLRGNQNLKRMQCQLSVLTWFWPGTSPPGLNHLYFRRLPVAIRSWLWCTDMCILSTRYQCLVYRIYTIEYWPKLSFTRNYPWLLRMGKKTPASSLNMRLSYQVLVLMKATGTPESCPQCNQHPVMKYFCWISVS